MSGADRPVLHGGSSTPACFTRLIRPYTVFKTLKVQDMDDFLDRTPSMPLVLQSHDIDRNDWDCLMKVRVFFALRCGNAEIIHSIRISLLSGPATLPYINTPSNGRASSENHTYASQIIDVWNASFFGIRGIKVILRPKPENAAIYSLYIASSDNMSSIPYSPRSSL